MKTVYVYLFFTYYYIATLVILNIIKITFIYKNIGILIFLELINNHRHQSSFFIPFVLIFVIKTRNRSCTESREEKKLIKKHLHFQKYLNILLLSCRLGQIKLLDDKFFHNISRNLNSEKY